MADTNTLISYDLNGKKLSFANWISNLSPTETPFVSMTGKESTIQTLFQWQVDELMAADVGNAVSEGSVADAQKRTPTKTLNNVTQILRKVVKVSDTANALANYGRGRELQYQMEKAGKEIKRDLEAIFLSAQEKDDGTGTGLGDGGNPRKTAAFRALVAKIDEEDDDTGAVVHKKIAGDEVTEADIFDMTYNLYLSGACADIIMYHPKYASFFASLMEVGLASRVKMFEGPETKFRHYVTEIIDPLGCAFKLIPNRWMPEDAIYFFAAKDWTQMVLRSPERVKLAKDGSYEKWMIEMEVGLRHRNPFASGVLITDENGGGTEVPVTGVTVAPKTLTIDVGASGSLTATVAPANATNKKVNWSSSAADVATVDASGKVTGVKAGTATITATTADGAKTDTAEVTVEAAGGITIDVSSATIGVAGEDSGILIDPTKAKVTITATAEEAVTAESDTTSVATVAPAAASGKSKAALAAVANKFEVTAVGAGTAKITFKAGEETKVATITVVASKLDVNGLDEMYTGETGQKAVATGAVGTFVWSVEKPEAADITTDGVITTKAPAKDTDIIATEVISGISFKGRAYLTVNDIAVTADPDTATVAVEGTVDISSQVKVTPASAAKGGVEYESVQTDTATVDAAGVVTGVAEGSVMINIKSKLDGTKGAGVTVTVTPKE